MLRSWKKVLRANTENISFIILGHNQAKFAHLNQKRGIIDKIDLNDLYLLIVPILLPSLEQILIGLHTFRSHLSQNYPFDPKEEFLGNVFEMILSIYWALSCWKVSKKFLTPILK